MRKLAVGTFLTLDGVMQAPGGPNEDREGGFRDDLGRTRGKPFVREALGTLQRRLARPERIVEVQRDGAYRPR